MAKEFVSKGYRVMIFDLFGRRYSDAPNDLNHDARLYTTQILLVLSSSPWLGLDPRHSISLIRTSYISHRSRFMYSSSIIPEWLRLKLLHKDLEPRNGAPNADVLDENNQAGIDFDEVPITADQPLVRIGDVVRWQLEGNPGFVPSYLSTIRSALVSRRHDRVWRLLGDEVGRRRTTNGPPGLPGGRICPILAERDVIVGKDDLIEDIKGVLCMETVDMNVIKGSHEIAVSRGKDVASIAIQSWNR
ncbi:hypothetical protein K432DRAFT_437110 [Lepidopterella palustris CBS 459.81]|uniref:Uncharacterized protein n=1 Tax=Lepidopterella palustris CBS 459.81 TaxID=1314670 RepID=A0A8E2E2T0_9PEZI|nr:hypothetical protein K432DRAFT_437110 [Lepidopterella palustris CBS 459.81]